MSYTFNHACCRQLYESISRRHEQAELARNKLIDNFSNLKLKQKDPTITHAQYAKNEIEIKSVGNEILYLNAEINTWDRAKDLIIEADMNTERIV